jgi:hypothetical protein
MSLAHKLLPGQNTEILNSKQEFQRRNCRLEHRTLSDLKVRKALLIHTVKRAR